MPIISFSEFLAKRQHTTSVDEAAGGPNKEKDPKGFALWEVDGVIGEFNQLMEELTHAFSNASDLIKATGVNHSGIDWITEPQKAEKPVKEAIKMLQEARKRIESNQVDDLTKIPMGYSHRRSVTPSVSQ